MKTRPLGRTGLTVSEICLGSMTWGTQNTEAEGHTQIDLALERGVNFIDTAELYPTTPSGPETYGRTEEIIGSWVQKSGRRDDIVLATKVAGGGTPYIRGGAPLSPATITDALDASLKRMQTDYIDLFQLHWPVRRQYHFRQHWTYDASGNDKDGVRLHVTEVLETLDQLVTAGKIRAIGLSNETVWGTMTYLSLAAELGLPRIATMQNEYSLLCRLYDTDFAELSHHEDVGLICYSPLATGLLTGKYAGGAVPPGSRAAIKPGLSGRMTPRAMAAAEAYTHLAQQHGLDPTQLALAFCLSRPFMTAPIIGATTLDHLSLALGATDVHLSEEILAEIDRIHRAYATPY